MVKSQPKEFRAKVINMGGTIRGWIPSPVVNLLGGSGGDYMVFRVDEKGNAKASIHRPTASEKRAALKKNKESSGK
jgi:hypothetical protein